MVLEDLGSAMKGVFQKITQAVFVSDKLIEDIIREIQRALLRADVDVKLVFELTRGIKERALKEKTPNETDESNEV